MILRSLYPLKDDLNQPPVRKQALLPSVTAELLHRAASNLADVGPTVLVDGGVENFNRAVDELVDSGLLKRLLARTEITFSNSLIESWWRVLKHQWLYLNTLDTVSAVENLVACYVNEHNRRLPHSAFGGQTSDEMYFKTGNEIPVGLRLRGKQHVRGEWRSIERNRARHVRR